MNAATLLQRLTTAGVHLTVDDGALEIDGPEPILTDALLRTIKTYKREILAQLTPAEKVPLPDLPPCAVCGGVDRWCDMDVWRCRTCWPSPLTAQARTPRPGARPQALPLGLRTVVAAATVPRVAPPCLHVWEQLTPRQACCVQCGVEIPGVVLLAGRHHQEEKPWTVSMCSP